MSTYELLKSSITNLTDTEESDITPQTALNAVGLDSLDYVSIQLAVKKEFGVEVDYGDFSAGKIATLGDFAGYIDARRPQ